MPDDEDDNELWNEVIKTVTPLGNRPKAEIPKNTRPKIHQHNTNLDPRLFDERVIFGGVEGSSDIKPLKIHQREARRISRGTMTINSTIDLHGANREVAYKMLVQHIINAHGRGEKLVLVVTGKGGRRFSNDKNIPLAQKRFSDFDNQEGVLKKTLPSWLAGVDLNQYVSSYKTAAIHHGGDGAVYVRLRREKP